MLDSSDDFEMCEAELGWPVEDFLTPLTRRNRKRPDAHFAIDNGAFAEFNANGFRSLLARENESRHLCRFVAVPDVVGNARRTLEVFDHWRYKLAGWPLALVMQNGMEDFSIPWTGISAVFIGGVDFKDGRGDWKLSAHAENIIRAAKALEKWVHIGRVNTPERFDRFLALGADSIDGTGIGRYSHMRAAINHPNLFKSKGATR